jgi:hypothetical protein
MIVTDAGLAKLGVADKIRVPEGSRRGSRYL